MRGVNGVADRAAPFIIHMHIFDSKRTTELRSSRVENAKKMRYNRVCRLSLDNKLTNRRNMLQKGIEFSEEKEYR